MVPAFFCPELWNGSSRSQQFVRSWPHADIFGEVFPKHRSQAIDQKLRRAGNIGSIGTAAGMQQFVMSNYFSLRIGEKYEGVASFAAKIFRYLRSINADGDGQDSVRFEFRKRLFDTPQLEVAIGSPVSSIENQQKSFRRLVPH